MKRLAAVAVVVALSVVPACAQRGGTHGGYSGSHSVPSGSHGGFSGSHGGTSGPRGGFSVHAPAFHGGSSTFTRRGFGGVRTPPTARFAGPSQPVSHRMPYPGPGVRRVGPINHGVRRTGPIPASPRQPNPDLMHRRMPYHSPYDGDGDHRGRDRDRDRDRDNDRDRDRFLFNSVYLVGGYPFWPGWGWGYPYLYNDWDNSDDYDAQPTSNYATAQQSYPEYAPGAYDPPEPDSEQPQRPSWPYSRPAPSASQPWPASVALPTESPVTLVFKDGRPNEQIHNYLMTATTLSVLDQRHRDIPVDQIDLTATARLNREAGIEFAIPGGSR